ncbi:SEC-C metal-binding domain-containing protein [Methylobacterium sp. ID0610]|uniref:SEC-C metal-binding domain-containing protein n=1 Tax=Methylobacterium carpenticola TaxID=3344827 RepID=UPI0036C40A44
MRKRLKIGRNSLCPCGSGRKFKRCHLNQAIDMQQISTKREVTSDGGENYELDKSGFHLIKTTDLAQLSGFDASASFGMDGEEPDVARIWYMSVCANSEELRSVMDPSTAKDWLLRTRADAILDSTRIFRVSVARSQRIQRGLLDDLYANDFSEYLEKLDSIDQLICEDVPSGFILTNIPNAQCVRTENGKIIIVSEVMRHFLYYMSLGTTELEVPLEVRRNALLIAVRVMFMYETMDFEIDPRGEVPYDLHAEIERVVEAQIQFVIGHEYAHHRLGHSFDDVIKIHSKQGGAFIGQNPSQLSLYKRGWEQEFEADTASVMGAKAWEARHRLVHGAIHFFLALYVFETVADRLDKAFASIDTHPPTVERFFRIVNRFGSEFSIDRSDAEKWLEYHRRISDQIIALAECQPENFRRYGSIYLAQWQGKPLVDRIDY